MLTYLPIVMNWCVSLCVLWVLNCVQHDNFVINLYLRSPTTNSTILSRWTQLELRDRAVYYYHEKGPIVSTQRTYIPGWSTTLRTWTQTNQTPVECAFLLHIFYTYYYCNYYVLFIINILQYKKVTGKCCQGLHWCCDTVATGALIMNIIVDKIVKKCSHM